MSAAQEPFPTYPARYAEPAPVATDAGGRADAATVALAGVVIVLVAAWGGIAPYAGPAFGYDPTTTTAWSWTLGHAVLALVPGAVGVLAGLSILGSSSRLVLGIGRLSLATAGVVAMVVGAWFVIGPSAWPVLRPVAGYFLPGTALHGLAARIGLAFGPGLVLAAFGAFTTGWAVRHRPSVAHPRRGLLGPRPVDPTGLAPVAGEPTGDLAP